MSNKLSLQAKIIVSFAMFPYCIHIDINPPFSKPEFLHKIYPVMCLVPTWICNFTPVTFTRFQGCTDEGYQAHIRCSYLEIQAFWIKTLNNLMDIEHPIQNDPTLVLRNKIPPKITTTQFKFLPQVLTAEKQTLARAWKKPNQIINLTKNRTIQTMILNKM